MCKFISLLSFWAGLQKLLKQNYITVTQGLSVCQLLNIYPIKILTVCGMHVCFKHFTHVCIPCKIASFIWKLSFSKFMTTLYVFHHQWQCMLSPQSYHLWWFSIAKVDLLNEIILERSIQRCAYHENVQKSSLSQTTSA